MNTLVWYLFIPLPALQYSRMPLFSSPKKAPATFWDSADHANLQDPAATKVPGPAPAFY